MKESRRNVKESPVKEGEVVMQREEHCVVTRVIGKEVQGRRRRGRLDRVKMGGHCQG